VTPGPDAPAKVVTLSIDGKEVTVPAGTLIIRAAEELGIEIPRFCDHPMLDPVAACRQCYVKVEGQRKLMTSCSTPVADGMVVATQFTDQEVKDAQTSVLEFLLINHPLDCPVCDRGGECPLQDQALAYGPGESRYVEAKRTYRKPLPLSPLVALDRERCVLCARCTRFCDQISGDRFIELFDRGAAEQVSIAPGEDFRSPFSGNTIQICPVGALTSRTYRFAARPFDLKFQDTVCPHCACGCNLRVDMRRGEVVRHLARDNVEVNDAWLCDKGRFAFSFPDRVRRLGTPLLRDPGLEPVSFPEAFEAIARWSGETAGGVAFLAGGRLSDEDAFALSKLARTVFGTNDVDHRQAGGDPSAIDVEAEMASGMAVSYHDVERATAILVVGLDAENELPILHLRIRKAARNGAKVFVVHPRRTRLWDVATHIFARPGDEAATVDSIPRADEGTDLAALRSALTEAGPDAVLLAGPRILASPGAAQSVVRLAGSVGAKVSLLCRRANDRGALRAGLHPALLPGGRRRADDSITTAWATDLPSQPGRDTKAILEAAARKEISILFLVGTDPLTDFPDAALARLALENVQYKVVVDVDAEAMAIYADLMLPAAPFLEKDGHYTDWEGRSQRLRRARAPFGLARSEWEMFQELSEVMGRDMGFHTLDDLHEEMAQLLSSSTLPEIVVDRDPGETVVSDEGLRLFSYPLLVDEGRLSVGADRLKEALEESAFVEVSSTDAATLGIADGATVRVRTSAGNADLPARVTEHLAPGCVFVPWNQPGLAANTLLSGSMTTPVAVEVAS
jgi:NADH-quinone oxidoreductase subunit G